MRKEDLEKYIINNEQLDEESYQDLMQTVEEYPFFHTAHLLLTKNRVTIDTANFDLHLHEASTFCADRKRLFYLINSEKYKVFFETDETVINEDRTERLLSSFLTDFVEESETEIKTSHEDNIIATDYLTYLEKTEKRQEEENNSDNKQNLLQHQNIIDDFLEKAKSNEVLFTPPSSSTKSTKAIDSEEEPDGGGFLTETLARIYIKQKKYEQALAIIKQLSLNFPKKSSYFADQLRFLEILILNEKNKKQ